MYLSLTVAKAAIRSMTVVLLLIYCSMYFPLFVGVLCLSLFWYVLLCVLSSFAIILKRKRVRAGYFAFIVLRMSCYCKCSVALPHGAMGWSAVCDCGIS